MAKMIRINEKSKTWWKRNHEHFVRQSELSQRKLRQLLHRGWISLVIGLTFLAAALAGGAWVPRLMSEGPLATVFRESLVIGGWVAMWRPLETFLYDWWPILGERRVYDRLSRMAVGSSTQIRNQSGIGRQKFTRVDFI